MKRAWIFRIATVVLLVAIAAVMMIIGRGHTVYLDNKDIEFEGKTYASPYKVSVSINGEKIAKLYNKERGMATWIGQNFTMDLEITETKGGAETTRTISLKLPYNMDGIVYNLTGILNDLPEETYLSEFIPAVTEEPEEEIVIDEFGGDTEF